MPVVLFGCETWSVTLREERRLRVFENRVLRRVFGPKRDKVTGEWRRLHDEELYDLYCYLNIIGMIKSNSIRWAGHVARMGVTEKHTVLLQRNATERDHLEDKDVDGKIFNWALKKWNGSAAIGLN